MAKNVFRPQEVVNLPRKVFIEPPRFIKEEEPVQVIEEVSEIPSANTPGLQEYMREAEEFRNKWETEKGQMVADAKTTADKIIKEAEQIAFEEVRKKTNQSQKIRQDAEADAKKIIDTAQKEAEELKAAATQKTEQIENEAFERGYREGHEQGFKGGKDEVDRLIERLHLILSKAIEKRNEIIEVSETQLVNLVLLISKKVIKVISENQKNVVINNVIQALRKLKSRGDVVIRVNLSDLELTTEHIKDFMKMVENVKSVTVLEDSSVDKGGCIIETDFGQIDARISSQLHEIEEKIVELMPIRVTGES
ncbi:MAG: flagellar assembly protein FliH [Spirochaetaceae bacterium]|nr:MAG: flagellar assembly protein FliH [Spirochaetaceae bacterium]